MQFSAEQLEAAVAAARAETATAVAAARTEATAAERARFAAVLALPEAQSRPKQALALALAGAEAAHASVLLNASQPDAQPPWLGLRSKDAPGGLVIDASGDAGPLQAAEAGGWATAVAKANARLEEQS